MPRPASTHALSATGASPRRPHSQGPALFFFLRAVRSRNNIIALLRDRFTRPGRSAAAINSILGRRRSFRPPGPPAQIDRPRPLSRLTPAKPRQSVQAQPPSLTTRNRPSHGSGKPVTNTRDAGPPPSIRRWTDHHCRGHTASSFTQDHTLWVIEPTVSTQSVGRTFVLRLADRRGFCCFATNDDSRPGHPTSQGLVNFRPPLRRANAAAATRRPPRVSLTRSRVPLGARPTHSWKAARPRQPSAIWTQEMRTALRGTISIASLCRFSRPPAAPNSPPATAFLPVRYRPLTSVDQHRRLFLAGSLVDHPHNALTVLYLGLRERDFRAVCPNRFPGAGRPRNNVSPRHRPCLPCSRLRLVNAPPASPSMNPILRFRYGLANPSPRDFRKTASTLFEQSH